MVTHGTLRNVLNFDISIVLSGHDQTSVGTYSPGEK